MDFQGLVDAQEHLSIQVHPDENTVKELESETVGKDESWFFLDAPSDGWIYAGCHADSPDVMEKAIAAGAIDGMIDRLPVHKGDYVCCHAGTVHALTAGSLVYEIEFGNNYTYRFYDYNRVDEKGKPRELQIKKALRSIRLDARVQSESVKIGEWRKERYYEVCVLENVPCFTNHASVLACLSIIKGKGRVDGCDFHSGMGILLLPGETIEGEFSQVIIAQTRME